VCTVIVSLEPSAAVPLLVLGIRDELISRPWQPPARHWPGSPLIGGRDEQAGGTWLALHPGIPRVACVLNGRGEPAPQPGRRSRGELPLRAAAEGQQILTGLGDDLGTLAAYDPFYLVCADRATASLLSWDGRTAGYQDLGPGTHVVTNAGLDAEEPKAKYFEPKFAAHRPSGDPAGDIAGAWGEWLTLAGGDGLAATDPRAIRVRRELPDGDAWGTTSVSLVALGLTGLRYDFQPVPGGPEPVAINPG
jgi:Transport and Golgi organisation 2